MEGDNGKKRQEGLSGTTIKNTWAKPKSGRIKGGKWGWVWQGKVVVGKWRQLYLNINNIYIYTYIYIKENLKEKKKLYN